MSAPIIESQIDPEQLRRRIDLLSEENRTLRELASPSAGPIELQAENILLQREAAELAERLVTLVPYSGPLPQTLEALAALPGPHARQIAREQPDHVRMLRQVEQLLRAAAANDRHRARRDAALEAAPVASAEQFAELTGPQRRAAAFEMTGPQRLAMLGELAADADEAYL